jgi:integrase
MSGKPYRLCSCRDPQTRKPLGTKCPDLRKKGHALGWFYRYEAPTMPGEKRRRPQVGPFTTEKAAKEDQAATLARIGGGAPVADRSLLVRGYITAWLAAKKLHLKPRTWQSYEEAIRLYFLPGLGHLRLVDLRDHHLQDLVTAMTQVNRPLEDGEKASETLRRLLAARADDERRHLPEGGQRHKKSTKPLSPARLEREFAVIRTALNDAVPGKILLNPVSGVVLPRVVRAKPLAWTPQREARFREELAKRVRAAEAAKLDGYVLTTVERQALWASADLRPAPAMTWLPGHCGRFLDYLDETRERLAALFVVTAFTGLRRDEVLGLTWAEVDLDEGVAYITETASGDGPKSEAGVRVVPLVAPVPEVLRTWRRAQAADRLALGPDWPSHDLVFTREDGSAIPPQWVSVRFETLAFRAGLVPARFHDLRHGAASMLKAAKVDTAVISAILGHSRTSFTDSQYALVFPDVAKAAAEAAVAIVPRRSFA